MEVLSVSVRKKKKVLLLQICPVAGRKGMGWKEGACAIPGTKRNQQQVPMGVFRQTKSRAHIAVFRQT